MLEVAIGTGHNLPYYPDGTRLPGIDFSPQMLQLARRRADRLGRPVDLRLGGAQALELPDACFDTVVCTLALCAIPDQRRAIAEMRRVLRPGGQLLRWTTSPPRHGAARAVQWLLERITIPLAGEHLRRRPLLQVQDEGFQVEQRERSKLGIVERLAARKPVTPRRHADAVAASAAHLEAGHHRRAPTAPPVHERVMSARAEALRDGSGRRRATSDLSCPGCPS